MTRAKDISKILTDADISGTLDVTGETTLATHLNLGDGDIIKLGASADLTIQHDGSDSIITDAGTGRLKIQGSRVDINKSDGSEGMATFIEDAQVILYHNNAVKLQTTSSGVDISGTIEADDKVTIAYESGSSDWELESTSGDDFTISRNGSQKLLIDGSTSNIGIGTSSPTKNLTIKGTASTLRLEDNTSGRYADIENSDGRMILRSDPDNVVSSSRFIFEVDGGEKLRIDENGKLLIGSTTANASNPLSKLQVAGSLTFSSNDLNSNTVTDTGISINQVNNGMAMQVLASNHSSSGTSTKAGQYFLKFFYDGNNAPQATLVAGDNCVTFGVSGSNTLTVQMPAGGNTISFITSG
jgi:hypothetical protein